MTRTRCSGRLARLTLVAAAVSWACLAQALANPQTVTVGGPFRLIAPGGATVSDQTYRGKWMLVYFGYTYCPVSCPTMLAEIADVLAALGPAAAHVRPIFITVDPERDTQEVLRAYTASFDSRIIGLTGTPDEIESVAEEYGAYFLPHKDRSNGEDYTIDHSVYLYLMDSSGRFVRAFDADWPPNRIADTLMGLISQVH